MAAICALAHPPDARACGATPGPEYWGVSGASPDDGATGVALDEPLVVRIWSGASLDGFAPAAPPPEALEVIVTDADGQTIPGAFASWPGDTDAVAWVPQRPMAPSTAYSAVVRITNSTQLPADAPAVAELVFSFETGDALLPPLSLDGAPTVDVEVRTEPIMDCGAANDCGTYSGPCAEVGTRDQGYAIVTLPGVTGGASGDGYGAWVWLADGTPMDLSGDPGSDSTPHEVSIGSFNLLEEGERTTLEILVPDEGHDYRGCFSFQVMDRANTTVDVEPVCIDVPASWSDVPSVGDQGDGTSTRGVSPAGGGGGCSVNRSPRSGGRGWAWVLAALNAVGWYRGRFRPERRPVGERRIAD